MEKAFKKTAAVFRKNKHAGDTVVATLTRIRAMLQTSREDAEEKEAETEAEYAKLRSSKEAMLERAKKSLTEAQLDDGGRTQAQNTAEDEVEALEKQIEQDAKFLQEAEVDFTVKHGEKNVRAKLRRDESAAMGKAIAILSAEEGGLKVSFISKRPVLLLQKSSARGQASGASRAKCKARLMASLASGSLNSELALVAQQAGDGSLDKVIEKVDELIEQKASEDADDLAQKETCEADLAQASKEARSASQEVDTMTEAIERSKSKVEEYKEQTAELDQKKKDLQGQLEQLAEQREKERTAAARDQNVDSASVEQIEKAKQVLSVPVFLQVPSVSKAPALLLATRGKRRTMSPGLEGYWRAADGNTVEIKDSKLVWQAMSWDISDVTSDDFKISGDFGGGSGEYTSNGIIWANGLKFTRTSADLADGPMISNEDAAASAEAAGAPSTFVNPYKSKLGDGGVITILTQIETDIKSDIQASKTEEENAELEYAKEKADLEAEGTAINDAFDDYTKDIARETKIIGDKRADRTTKAQNVQSQLELYKTGLRPGCDFLLVNFDVRAALRHQEVDGLKTVKMVLEGKARVPESPEPEPELTLLQKTLKSVGC